MSTLITAIANMVSGICSFANTEKLMSYPDKVAAIQKALLEEQSKGYQSDDAKVEMLLGQLNIVLGELNNEIALLGQQKPTSTVAAIASAVGSVKS